MSVVEEFIAYLESKNIDSKAFKKGDPTIYSEWENYFSEVHPKSFTAQKLYLINSIRRRFQLAEGLQPKPEKKKTHTNKPKLKVPGGLGSIKPKLKSDNEISVKKLEGDSKEADQDKQGSRPVIPRKKDSTKVGLNPKLPGRKKTIPISEESTNKEPSLTINLVPKRKVILKPRIPKKQPSIDTGQEKLTSKDNLDSVNNDKTTLPKKGILSPKILVRKSNKNVPNESEKNGTLKPNISPDKDSGVTKKRSEVKEELKSGTDRQDNILSPKIQPRKKVVLAPKISVKRKGSYSKETNQSQAKGTDEDQVGEFEGGLDRGQSKASKPKIALKPKIPKKTNKS